MASQPPDSKAPADRGRRSPSASSQGPASSQGLPPLGAFLRERRMRLNPEDVGVARRRGRAGTGLRPAEVAELADISLAYYTFIEQGRDLRPSTAVLDSLGRALRLTAGERRMLHDLRADEARRPRLRREEIGEEIEELAEILDPNPTYVMGARWDILASNRAAQLLFVDWNSRPSQERNMLWYYLCDPSARTLYVDWETEAADQVAHFRESYAQHGDDPSFTSLLEAIFAITPTARSWWERHDAEPNRSGVKRIRLEDGRVVLLRQLVLESADNPQIQIVTYFADMSGDEDGDEDGDDGDSDSREVNG